MQVVVLFVIFAGVVNSQRISFGSCPKVQTKSNFDLNQYLGTWYEIYKFPAIFEYNQKCVTAKYSVKPDGHIKVDNSGVRNGKTVEAIGDAYIPDTNEASKLLVKFAQSPAYGDYWVLDTDYKNYTVIYSCGPLLGLGKVEFAWILGRQRTLDTATKDKLFNLMKGYGIYTEALQKEEQSNC